MVYMVYARKEEEALTGKERREWTAQKRDEKRTKDDVGRSNGNCTPVSYFARLKTCVLCCAEVQSKNVTPGGAAGGSNDAYLFFSNTVHDVHTNPKMTICSIRLFKIVSN